MTDAAIAAKQSVRAGLVNEAAYEWSAEAYRMWLFDTGKREKEETPDETSEEQAPTRKKARGGVDPVKRAEVLSRRGRMGLGELLRHRVRYFSDGAVIGSREFVEAVFEANRDRFGPRRQTGARRIGESAEPFFSLRQLRRKPVG